MWKHRTVQENSRHMAISDWDLFVPTHHFKGGSWDKSSSYVLTSLEPGIVLFALLRTSLLCSWLKKTTTKKATSTNVMNISSNQSHKEKKTMFTARKRLKVTPGCKYKKRKTRIGWFCPQTQQEIIQDEVKAMQMWLVLNAKIFSNSEQELVAGVLMNSLVDFM